MKNEMFTWTSPGGVEIAIPPMKRIKAGVIRKHRKLEPIDAAFSILETIADEETLAKIDELDSDELNDMMKEWQAEVGVGESSGSSS